MLRRRLAHSLFVAAGYRGLTVTPIPMPALSPTMEKGKIAEWAKKIGDTVESGDSFCKVETDKAVVAYENVTEEGFVARILVKEGEEVQVGETVCLLVDEKEGITSDEVKNWSAGGSKPSSPAAAKEASPQAATPPTAAAPSAAGGSRIKASPLAKKTAKELGVALENVEGTGGGVGRIVKKDVEAALAAGTATKAAQATISAAPSAPGAKAREAAPSAANFTDVPVTSMRATIAKRLTQSKNVEVPHYYLFEDCAADNMLALIKQLNAKGAGSYKITVNDYIVKAVARANMLVPEANSSWQGDVIRQYHTVDVSVAVATPTGLITPIIKNAHIKGLAEISVEMKALAAKAREGTLQPNEFVGGTVSVSNLGASGIPGFTAIINPPQSLILAVGSAKPRPQFVLNAETGEYEMTGKAEMAVKFSASFDHRVVDGAVGAKWCQHFRDAVENPLSLLL